MFKKRWWKQSTCAVLSIGRISIEECITFFTSRSSGTTIALGAISWCARFTSTVTIALAFCSVTWQKRFYEKKFHSNFSRLSSLSSADVKIPLHTERILHSINTVFYTDKNYQYTGIYLQYLLNFIQCHCKVQTKLTLNN